MKKGLAVVSKILLFVVIMLIGFSAYTAYLYYSDNDFDFYGLRPFFESAVGIEDVKLAGLPDELQPYAVGEDADMFIIAKFDDIPLPDEESYEPFKEIDTVLVLGKGCPKCAFGSYITAVILFESEEGAQDFKKFYDEDEALGLVMARFKSSIEGKVVVLSGRSDFREIFTGRLADNPHMKYFSEDDMNANFVFYADNINIPEFSMVSFSLMNSISGVLLMSYSGSSLPLAHAQGVLISPTDQPGRLAEAIGGEGSLRNGVMMMLSFALGMAKDFSAVIDYHDEQIESRFRITIPAREEFSGLPGIKMAYGDDPDQEIINELYDETVGDFEKRMSELEKSMDALRDEYPDVDLDFSYTENSIDFKTSFSLENFAPDTENPGDAPSRARDASRKADLNNILVALETFNAEKGLYPQKTACVGDLSDLQEYFMKGESPKDYNGAQTFENGDGSLKITCDDGYLYQYFGDDEYLVWARMENLFSGNMPYLIEDKVDDDEYNEGRYFAAGNVDNSVAGVMYPYVDTEKKGVSRVKNPVLMDNRIELSPGQIYLSHISVTNRGVEERLFKMYGSDPTKDVNGRDAFKHLNMQQEEFGTWVVFEEGEAVLEPGANNYYKYSLTVPEDTAPGEYRGGIVVQTDVLKEGDSIPSTSRTIHKVTIVVADDPDPNADMAILEYTVM